MGKFITREIKMYEYTFASVDVSCGTLTNKHSVRSTSPLTRADKKRLHNEFDGAVLVQIKTTPVKYSLPLDLFVKKCEEYAALVEAGEAESPESDTAEEYSES